MMKFAEWPIVLVLAFPFAVGADERPDPPKGFLELLVNGCHLYVPEAEVVANPRQAWVWDGRCKGSKWGPKADGWGVMRVYSTDRKLIRETTGTMSAGLFKPEGKPQSTQQQSGQGLNWDSWMQATGNAPMPTPRVDSVKVTGNAAFSVDQVKRACANVMHSTAWSITINMGMKANGTLAAVTFLQAVDSSEVGGPVRTILPKGRVTPAKISFLFPQNVRIDDAKVYLFKDSFGDAKCFGPA